MMRDTVVGALIVVPGGTVNSGLLRSNSDVYRPVQFGFLVSTSGYPAGEIDWNKTYMGSVSAGTQTQNFFPVSLVCKLAMCSTAKANRKVDEVTDGDFYSVLADCDTQTRYLFE